MYVDEYAYVRTSVLELIRFMNGEPWDRDHANSFDPRDITPTVSNCNGMRRSCPIYKTRYELKPLSGAVMDVRVREYISPLFQSLPEKDDHRLQPEIDKPQRTAEPPRNPRTAAVSILMENLRPLTPRQTNGTAGLRLMNGRVSARVRPLSVILRGYGKSRSPAAVTVEPYHVLSIR